MRPIHILMPLACLVFSCSPLKQATSTDTQMPGIAAIGKKDKSLLHADFKQVGEPNLNTAIAVLVQAVPFNKSKFKEYQRMKLQKGEKSYVSYVDSLPVKPKYLRFEIADKIGLKSLLNNEANEEVRSYLTKDADCQIVSEISIYMDEMEADMYLRAEGLFLVTDTNGMLRLELVNGKQKQMVNLAKNEIFDYKTMGFCWGDSMYGKPQIETLNVGGNCPEGTEKNAQKLDNQRTYLKL